MKNPERYAYWRGYNDYQTYRKLLLLHPRWASDSRGLTSWWPVEGHEDAYRMGWETARHQAQENGAALLT
jgi:hypothetical protein